MADSPPDEPRLENPLPLEVAGLVFLELAPALRRFILRTGCLRDNDMEDVQQETWRRAWQALPRFRWYSNAKAEALAWMERIARNVIIDRRRKHRFDRSLQTRIDTSSGEAKPTPEPLATDTPSRAAARVENHAAVRSALSGLPADWRTAIELRYMEGLPYEEIAKKMGKTKAQVRGYLQRGREELRAILGRASFYLSSC